MEVLKESRPRVKAGEWCAVNHTGFSMRRSLFTVVLVAAYVVAQFPVSMVLAQSGSGGSDLTPPTIVHTPPTIPMVLDEPFLVHAVVTDDVGVARVRLYFRAEAAQEYRSVEMAPAKAGSYTATIPAHHRADRAIEYFIQAEDAAGNIALRGAAFEPMRIADPSTVDPSLIPKEDPAARLTMKTPAPSGKPWYKKWWVWTIAGAVVIGAAAGGGGGGGGDDNADPPGTATITAPIP